MSYDPMQHSSRMTQFVEYSWQGMHLNMLPTLYFLLCLLHIVRHKALVNNIGASFLWTDLPSTPIGIRNMNFELTNNALDSRLTMNHGTINKMTELGSVVAHLSQG